MEKVINDINTGVESKKRWLHVFLGIIIMMCLGTVYSWSVFRISIEKIFEIGTAQSGLPYMISLASYAVFMLLTGKYLDRYSPRSIILLGSLLVGGGWILSGFASNIYVLTCTYGLITGAGVGIVYGVPMTVAAKWFPEKKGLIVGLVLVGFGLSPFITAPIAGHLIETYGVMAAFKILGAAFIVLMPAVAYPLSYPAETGFESAGKSSGADVNVQGANTSDMMKSKSFKGLYLSFLIGAMIGLMLIGMTSNVGIELIKLSRGKVVLLMSLFAVFNGVGRPTFGWITGNANILHSYNNSVWTYAHGERRKHSAVRHSIFNILVQPWRMACNCSDFNHTDVRGEALQPKLRRCIYGIRHRGHNRGSSFGNDKGRIQQLLRGVLLCNGAVRFGDSIVPKDDKKSVDVRHMGVSKQQKGGFHPFIFLPKLH